MDIQLGKYNDFYVDDSLDVEGLLGLDIFCKDMDYYSRSWLDRENAIKLVEHLDKLFGLKIKYE